MRPTLEVGLVGAGAIAAVHLEALRALPGVRVVGVTDVDMARAQALVRRVPDTPALPSLAALVGAGAQVIHVLTPPAAHADVTLAAMGLGCDVLVEKPLAASVADAARVRAAARRLGRRVVPCHSLLTDPGVARVLAAARDGRLGRVLDAEYVCSAVYPPWGDEPVPPPYRDGGFPFRDLGVHGLYLLRALLGEVRDLHVERRHGGADPNLEFDEWDVLLRCAQGTGRIRLSWGARPLVTQVTVRGTRATCRADVGAGYVARRRAWPLPSAVARGLEVLEEAGGALGALPRSAFGVATGRLRSYPGLRAFIAAAAAHFAGHAVPPATLDDGLTVVRLVEAVAAPADEARCARRTAPLPSAPGTVLVTGAGGLLGSHCVRRLVAEGVAVRALVHRTPEPGVLPPGVAVVVADLGDAQAVDRAVTGCAGVIHAGAAMRGPWTEHARATVAGTRHVLAACARHGVGRLVHVSSLSVLHWAALDGRIAGEAAPLEPHAEQRGRYTRAKLAAERLVGAAVARDALPAVIVRPGILIGPAGPDAGMAGAIAVGRTLWMPGPGDAPLPLVDVEDAADALVRALRAPLAPGTILHVVDARQLTQRELARRVASAQGRRLRHVPRLVMRTAALAAEGLGRVLGVEPPLTRARLRAAWAACAVDATSARRLLGWAPAGASVTPPARARRASASGAAAARREADTAPPSPDPDAAPEAAAP